ncbi:TlpA disulfide reductase family protein [Mycolicibacterium sp. F2034L]|uniref:TlpA family protein disulfide reductase n=1 Tax=Mycolicibacterium sp. F2034L TaxID=2926422 RepID=UPI001FF51E49|nr:TlpA disulfide reductase family protein [Mycolicibacterium sp. F2034L]MCK0176417.1 TlpA family protein disulfide reductase [Mycolicibacterium sp. F2034L]
MTTSIRWAIALLTVTVALIVALALQLTGDSTPPQSGSAPARDQRAADTPQDLAAPRAAADLPPCPAPGPGPGPAALQGIELTCAGDGAIVDVAKALAGRTVVLNLWAYWCGPCADELPAMQEYQRRAGADTIVVTVHQDQNEAAGLYRLADLGVRLPTIQDSRRLIAAALKVPNVMPATVILRPDGSVAGILPRSFATADEIAVAVQEKMGEPG